MTSSSPFGSYDHPRFPHILLLITDQFRYDAFGPTTTPNLYKLATTTKTHKNKHSATTLFSNAYSSTPTCTPARAALLTGKSPWNHGMLGYNDAVNCEEYPTTLPSVLRDLLGYHTAMVGKNHFGFKPTDDDKKRKFIDHGYQSMELYDGLTEIPDDYDEYFDRMLPGEDPMATCNLEWNDWKACPYKYEEHLHPTAWTTREALKVLDEQMAANNHNNTSSNNQHRPLFLKVSYHRPHSPYDPPKRLWDKHQHRSINISDPIYARNIGTDPTSWDREYLNSTAMLHNDWHGDPGEKASRMTRAAYLANAEFVDEEVGKILERWNQLNGENAFVVWLSDHGDMNGDHNLWRKGYPWEASTHVNMAMKLPAAVKATKPTGNQQETETADAITSDAVVEIRDIAPTIYDLLGILENVTNADPLINGKSLLPILQRNSKSVRNHLDMEHSTLYDDRIHWNAIVGTLPDESPDNDCKLYKYVFFASTGNEQLFCLSIDPLEQIDLASNSTYEKALLTWRNTMTKDFDEEDRGENWVTSNGTLAIRTQGTTLGPNYPCHNKEPPTEPLWKQVEIRDEAFLQQHMMNSENAVPKEAIERSLNMETPNIKDGIDTPIISRRQPDTGIVFCVTTLFLSILVLRYYCWFKRKTRPSKKYF